MTQTTTAPARTEAPTVERTPVTQLMWQGGTLIALLGLIAFFGIMRPDAFFSFGNVRNILMQISILAIIAAAQTVVMVVGDFDLSVGSNASLSGATAAALMINETPIPIAIIAGLAVGLGIGIVNGILVAYLGISAIIATLATMTTFSGLAFIVTSGTTLYGMPEEFHVLGQGRPAGIPMPVIFATAIALIIWFMLRFTTLGRRWYAVG
ncbi:MAG TPA: ABC transporter permease, partial [Actinomycetaceae bacterium]|nr:ABC transporter permease [Actinomycetaceae bacterium]